MPRPRWLRWFQPGAIAFVIAALVMWALVSVSGPSWPTRRDRLSRARRAELQLDNLASAIDMFRMDHKRLPDRLEDLTQTTEASPEPYVDHLPRDPWGQAYAYTPSGTTFELRSLGRDGRPQTGDDLVWEPPKLRRGG